MAVAIRHLSQRSRNVAAGWLAQRYVAVAESAGRHAAIYALAVVTYSAGLLQNTVLGRPLSLDLTGLINLGLVISICCAITCQQIIELVRLWRSGYPGSATRALSRNLFEHILSPGRITNGVHAFLATGVFGIGWTTLKSNIPLIVPFRWDETFMRLDKALHFGLLPHEILAPLLQYPLVTFLLNVTYNMWFVMLLGFFIWQGFREADTRLRQRFLIAYLLCWLLGTGVLGLIFSSAGPCFYDRVVAGDNPYSGLMAYLAQIDPSYPIWAVSTQDRLWHSYVTGEGTISGISAMPSMHVGTSVIFLLCARASGIRWLTRLCAVFVAAIFAGSIMLGWHYAVDGYAGALVALASWAMAGRISSRPSSGRK